MTKTRLEAFSDGVVAIIITIMVLELHPPEDGSLHGLRELLPDFLVYLLSFVFVGIYWSNHHHLLHAATRVTGGILWANLHLLFWLSLVPFVTAWVGDFPHEPLPVAMYGVVLLMNAIAYTILARRLMSIHGRESALAQAMDHDTKGWMSLAAYVAAVPLAFVAREIAFALYIAVALIWLVPDRRIEKRLH